VKPPSAQPPDRERFLAAVAERVPLDRVVELYLFQPIRQGGVESGVAVIATEADAAVAPTGGRDGSPEPADAAPEQAEVADLAEGSVSEGAEGSEARYTVFTARYRHVLKGAERGRWEVAVTAEADAPLDAVGAVVRGVQRRAGDAEPPEHITGDALRDAFGQKPHPGP
jgi:hypothetical protein